MEIETILSVFDHGTGYFPRGPLKAAIAQKEEITPDLLAVVDRARREIDRVLADDAYMTHLYAFYLLAQFREQRAYPMIVDFFSIPGEVTLDVTGDFVTEDLGRVLASVSGGDVEPMVVLVENASANRYVRGAALDGMVCLVVEGIRQRDEIITMFRDLFRRARERKHSFAWDALVASSTALYPEELMGDIRRAFADDLVDELFIDLEWVEHVLAQGKDAALTSLRGDRHYYFVEDVIAEMEWWACFDPVPGDVGRNDPCPCGSGWKYKYCCWTPG